MRGGPGVRPVIASHLKNGLPARLVTLREEWGVESASLPDVVAFHDRPLAAIDKWPAVACSRATATNVRRSEHDAPDVVLWVVTYDCEVYVYVNAPGVAEDQYAAYDQAIDQCENLVAAVRYHLLDKPEMATGSEVVLRDDSMREEYADPQKLKGDRWGTAGMVAFQVEVEESITRPSIGTVVSTAVEVDRIPHPALED